MVIGRGLNQDGVEWLFVKNNESSASILGGEFREQLSNDKLLEKIPRPIQLEECLYYTWSHNI